ncbi:MAG: hypothetical protein HQK95_09110 [Nitrospirae bacterium]|nr:hypothetical protein [Nitrospirota bacterium]
MKINTGLIGFEAVKPCEEIATLDMDATLSETSKKESLYSYEGEKAYQPLNTYWHERDVLLHIGRIEFAIGYDVTKPFREAVMEVAEED